MHNLDKGPSCGHSWGRLFNPWNPRHLAICSLPDTEKVKVPANQGSTNPLTHRSLQWIHLNWSQWKRMPYNSSVFAGEPPGGSPWRYNLSPMVWTGGFEEWLAILLGQAYQKNTHKKSHPCARDRAPISWQNPRVPYLSLLATVRFRGVSVKFEP